ncbi:MAG: 4Fe-4S binding protein [Eubacteriales bacterium]|nr:4Fe-4S binding protein [Eubacteriales bacterium]
MAKVSFNTDMCKGCGLCVSACPKHIIVLSDTLNKKGYSAATVNDMEACVGCASCALMCPDCIITVER